MSMQERSIFIFVITAYLICGIYGLFQVPLGGEEPRRAYLAVESLEDENPIIMRHYGQLYFNKPPVHHALNFLSILSFGPCNFAYRLTSFLSYVFMGLLLFRLLRPRSGQWAYYGLFIFILGPDLMFYQSIKTGEIDGLFALIVFIQFIFFYNYSRKPHAIVLVMAYFAGALAFLTKGLPGIFITAMGQLTVWLCGERKLQSLLWHPLLSVLSLIVVLISYFGYYEYVTGRSSVYLLNLIKESTSKSVEGFEWYSFLKHFFIDFPVQVIKFSFPFIFIALALFLKKGNRVKLSIIRKNRLVWFSLIYLMLNIWPYWLSSYSKSRYIIPFIPVVAILLGSAVARLSRSNTGALFRAQKSIPVLIPQLLLIVAALVLIPDLPIYKNYLFVFYALVIYAAVMLWLLKFKTTPLIANRTMYTYAMVLVGIKFLLVYGILSEPLKQENRTKAISNYIYENCKGYPVYTTGSLEEHNLSFELGQFRWEEKKFKPPLMAYQIPLNYYEKTGRSMQYQAKIEQSGCYLRKVGGAATYLEPGVEKNSFVDPWTYSKIEIIKVQR